MGIVKLGNEMDRLKMANETLTRDRGVLTDEVKSLKMELDALKKRMADMDRDNRKLVQEINVLTRKLTDSENRLKVEVEGIKKKMAITITELEMSLDASNKSNSQLQNTTKIQAQKIMELTAAYDDVNKKLGASVQQYDITIKRLTAIEAEFKSLTVTYNNTLKIVKDYEGKMGGLNKQVSELTSANNSLSQFKVKIEKELAAVTRDYQDIAKELKLADDRANKAAADAGHFESLLREEQTKVVKIDSAKKALENEVRSLSVKIEEIETNSVATSKRTIQKMEIRIQELEVMINEEKKSHASTMSELHTKTRSIKELVLQSEEDRKNIIILQESLDKLNEKIKMYKRQLEEQESISNSNIMRVKKFQRELESAESRAEEAESCLNSFRSQQRVFAAAAESKSREVNEVEREVVVRKNVTNVSASSANVSRTAIQTSSSSAAEASSSLQQQSSSSAAMAAS